jgi:glycosyltransferase involved in cell wall biosynthesis
MYQNKKITVIIPAYNEERALSKVITNIPPIIDEIIVIDDGSSDNTYIKAKELGTRAFRCPKNCGKGYALRWGFRLATGDIIICVDADGQQNPQEIEQFLDTMTSKNCDMVIGSRFLGSFVGGSKHFSYIRYYGNIFFSTLVSWLAGQKITDSQTGFIALNAYLAKKLNLKITRWGIHQEIIIKISRSGGKIVEIPRQDLERPFGKSKILTISYFITCIHSLSRILIDILKNDILRE